MQAGNLIRSRSTRTISFTFSTDNGDGCTKYNFIADAVVSIPSLEIEDMEIWQGGELYQSWFDGYHQIFSYACKFAKELVKEDMRVSK